MAKKDDKCCPEKVQFLIENEATPYEEGDREWLESLTEVQIDKMTPTANEEDPLDVKSNSEAILNAVKKGMEDDGFAKSVSDLVANNNPEDDPPVNNEEDDEVTEEQYIQNAPVGIQSVLKEGLDMQRQAKDALIKQLLANANNAFSEDELKEMELGELKKLGKLAQVQNFEGSGGTIPINNGEEEVEPLDLPIMNFGGDAE